MTIISALIGLIAGITLTLLSEVVKRASQKKVAATKLYAELILLSKEILESDVMSLAGLAQKIYKDDSYKDVGTSAKLLNELIDKIKIELAKDSQKYFVEFKNLKEDNHHLEKYIHLFEIYEEKYKNDNLLLHRNEISYLSPKIQPAVIELIENTFQCSYHLKYFLIRIQKQEINVERNINDFTDVIKYMTKIHKDRKKILDYSKNLAEKNFIRVLFDTK